LKKSGPTSSPTIATGLSTGPLYEYLTFLFFQWERERSRDFCFLEVSKETECEVFSLFPSWSRKIEVVLSVASFFLRFLCGSPWSTSLFLFFEELSDFEFFLIFSEDSSDFKADFVSSSVVVFLFLDFFLKH